MPMLETLFSRSRFAKSPRKLEVCYFQEQSNWAMP